MGNGELILIVFKYFQNIMYSKILMNTNILINIFKILCAVNYLWIPIYWKNVCPKLKYW